MLDRVRHPARHGGEAPGLDREDRHVSEEQSNSEDDADDLGTAAQVLFEDGKSKAAALLIDARIVERQYLDTGFPLDDEAPGIDLFAVVLEVPRFLVERFDDEVVSDIQDALNEVMLRDHVYVKDVRVRSELKRADKDWRQSLQARMAPRVTNQASIGPRMTDPIWDDRCAFRSREEHRVYLAFKRARAKLPDDDSIALAPNPALVVQNVNTSEPDLLVMYRGRVGIIHVDGPSHHGRFAAEASRDRLYRHSGIAEVDHFVVEDTRSDDDLDVLVTRFLKRLAG